MTDDTAAVIPAWLVAKAEAEARHPLVQRPAWRSRFVRFAGARATDRVLDIGCGSGHGAIAFARRVAHVTGLDWRPELLAMAQKSARRRRLRNLEFVEAHPQRLTFPNGSFDTVISAAAVHHFASPLDTFHEMSRVCRAGGRVVIEDVVAAEQDIRSRYHNRLERLRDRSHQRFLKLSELITLVSEGGLAVERLEMHDSLREFSEWVAVTRPPIRRAEHIRRLLQGSIEHDLSGLDVGAEDDTFVFVQRVAWLLCSKRE